MEGAALRRPLSPTSAAPPRSSALSALGSWLRSPAAASTGLALLFIAISGIWAALESRPPDIDSGAHLDLSQQYWSQFSNGEWGVLWDRFDIYTPFVHAVGAFAVSGGPSVFWPTFIHNLFFVPMLAVGCHLAGREMFGRWGGPLSVLFVLGVPMLISQFHAFMLDAPVTACVGLTVGLLLVSNRFEGVWWSLGAGVVVGIGLLTKNTYPAFVAGLVIVLLIRGGWRNWKGLLAFCVAALLVAGPWYFDHWGSLVGLATERAEVGRIWYADIPYADRFEVRNYTWYFWNAINNQLYLPLFLLACAGAVTTTVWFFRKPKEERRRDYTPELLAGGIVGYIAISQLAVDDPRYSLPLIVYAAIFGGGFIAKLKTPRLRWAVGGLLAAIVLLNTVATNLSAGPTVEVDLPGATESPIREWNLTFSTPDGYVTGAPDTRAGVPEKLQLLADAGVKRTAINTGGMFLDPRGFGVLLGQAGLGWGANYGALGPQDVFIYRRELQAGMPPPCSPLDDDNKAGLYYVRGANPPRPYDQLPLVCPGDASYPSGLKPPAA